MMPPRKRCCGDALRHSPGSISNLCSATLGAGALSLPFAMRLTGTVVGVILLLFSAYLTVVSINIIIEACRRTKLFKYEDVSVTLAGKPAARVLELSLLLFCFGTAVAYISAIGDILDKGVRSTSLLETNTAFLQVYSRRRVMVFFWTVVMFPLSLQRRVESLERFSSIGVLSIVFLVLSVAVHSISNRDAWARNVVTQELDYASMVWPNSLGDVLKAFPMIIFAFSCQVNVCAIYEELSSPDIERVAAAPTSDRVLRLKETMMSEITKAGVLLCMVLYICIGMFGYLEFSFDVDDNILNNYGVDSGNLMILASAFVCVAIVVAFPFNILPARVTLKLMYDRARRGGRCRVWSTCAGCLYPNPRTHSQDEINDGANTSYQSHENPEETPVDRANMPLLEDGDGERSARQFKPLTVPHMSMMGEEIEFSSHVAEGESTPVEHFVLTLLLSGSALIAALLVPGISVVFGLMGGTASSVISFILPGQFMLSSDDLTPKQRFLAQLLLYGGIVVGLLTTGVTVQGMFV